MSWKNIMKINPNWNKDKAWPSPDTWYKDMDMVIYIGMVFEDLFGLGIGGESIWYYITKPYKYTPEYTVLREAGLKLNLDAEGVNDWMDKNNVHLINELEQRIKEGDLQ